MSSLCHEGAVRIDAPAVSVVIPSYNRGKTLSRCLDSLVNQSFGNFEVIVCDDGSTDETREIVYAYCRKLCIFYHWIPNSGGPARPRNIGIRRARAPYVAFLDSDDWWAPDKLDVTMHYLATGADIVYHDLYLVQRPGGLILRRLRARNLLSPVFDDLLVNGNTLFNSSVVVSKKLLEDIGLITEDPDMRVVEDYDTWLRISRLTEKFVRIPKVLGYYWAGGGNISNPSSLMQGLRAVEKRYAKEFQVLPWSLSYAYGRCNYLLGNFVTAGPHLLAVLKNAPFLIRSKAIWMLIVMLFSGCKR